MLIQPKSVQFHHRVRHWPLAAIAALNLTASATAQDSEVLLDLLQKRGVLNNKDAAEVRADFARRREQPVDINTSAARLKLSDSVSEMKIFGEVRLGYRINEAEAAGLDAGD